MAFIQVLAFKPFGLEFIEFEMSVHRICEFDPFWTKKFILQKDRQTETRTDIEAQIVV